MHEENRYNRVADLIEDNQFNLLEYAICYKNNALIPVHWRLTEDNVRA